MDLEEASWRRRRAGQVHADGEEQRSGVCRGGCVRFFLNLLFPSVGLLVLVVSYCFLGALLFQFLEREYEVEEKREVDTYRDECIKELWLITERLNILYAKNWTVLVNEQLQRFEMNIVSMAEAEGYIGGNAVHPQRQQSFAAALFYSITVMTTIGFGKSSPRTPTHKMVTMVYAVVGVPLTVFCLAYVGTLLANTFQNAYLSIWPDLSSEILGPLTDKIDCKSHPNLVTQSLDEADLEEDFDESTEIPDESSTERPRCGLKSKRTSKSNSIMLRSMNLALDDLSQNLTGSTSSERHSLLVECAECSAEQESVSSFMKLNMGKEDSSEMSGEEEVRRDEMNALLNGARNLEEMEFCEEERETGEQSHCNEDKEWAPEHQTPSRIPLIGRSTTPSSNCSQHTVAENKYTWNSSLAVHPPTPVPLKSALKRKEQRSRHREDSSSLAGSDRHLCSASSSAAASLGPLFVEEIHIPAWLILGILGAYICLGGAIIASWEGWTFLEGAYFCFLSLSTIGFGDYFPGVPLKVEKSIQPYSPATAKSRDVALPNSPTSGQHSEVEHRWTLVACCAYFLFGLMLVASSVTLMQKKLVSPIHRIRKTLDLIKSESSEVAEECDEGNDQREDLIGPSFNRLYQ